MSKQISHKKCEQWLATISDYIDGELPATTFDELEAHLAICPDCTLLVNTTKKSIDLAQRLISRQMPENIKIRLLAAICEANKSNYSDNDLVGQKDWLIICPQCGEKAADVDGMLNRYCTKCDWREGGGFT